MEKTLTRRTFSKRAIQSLLTFSFLDILSDNDLFAASLKPLMGHWLKEMDELGRDVKDGTLKQVLWQEKVEALFAKVDLADFLKLIKFADLEKKAKDFDRKGAQRLAVRFPEVEGVPTKLVFGRQIFALKKGRSVIPHGHDNMATAFWMLKGSFRGRHWERLEDEEKHMIIKSSIDRTYKKTEASTISDLKDNVHWYQALEDGSFLFNIHVLGLDSKKSRTGRVYVDPAGEKLEDGKIRARLINHREAMKLYG